MTEHQDDVPVAVIGFSVNFPQQATSSAAFWRMLVEGRSARSVVPPERFNINSFYHPDEDRHDTVSVVSQNSLRVAKKHVRSKTLSDTFQRRPSSDPRPYFV